MPDFMTPKSFNGVAINDGILYIAGFPEDTEAFVRTVAPVVLDQVGGYARTEGFDHVANAFHIWVSPVAGTVLGSVDALKQVFRPGLVGVFIADFNGTNRARSVIVEGVYPHAVAFDRLVIRLRSADPRWYDPAPSTVDTVVTATGQSWFLTNNGNAVITDAIFRFTPNTQKPNTTAYRWRQKPIIVNRVASPLTDWPIDITNGGFNHAALVSGGKSLASGDDVRVLLDGVEIPRFFGENAATVPNQATTRIWCTIPYSAMVQAHLLNAITAISPANGGSLLVQSGEVKDWPQKGFFRAAAEVFSYDGWVENDANGNSAFLNIKRAQMDTVAAIGSAAQQLLRVEHDIDIIYGWSDATTHAPTPEARPDIKPMLDLSSVSMNNVQHEWIAMYDDLYPDRPGQWSRLLEARDAQAGFIFLPTSPAGPAATSPFEYIYSAPPAAKDNVNVLRRAFPVGTSAGSASEWSFTRTLDQTMSLWLLGVQANGSERVMDRLFGPLASGTYTYTPGGYFYELAFYARSAVTRSVPEIPGRPLSGVLAADSHSNINPINATGFLFFKVTNPATELMVVRGVEILLAENTAPKTDVRLVIYSDNGGVIGSYVLATVTVPLANISTVPTWLGGIFDSIPPAFPLLPGMTVWIQAEVNSGGSHSVANWYDQLAGMDGQFPIHAFRFIADGQIDGAARAQENEKATIDNVVVKFDAAGVPAFSLQTEHACYWLNGTLFNDTTSQSLAFSIFCSPSDQIEVDCGKRTIKNLTTGREGLIYGMTSTDKDQWINIAPGSNAFRYTESGVVNLTVEAQFSAVFE